MGLFRITFGEGDYDSLRTVDSLMGLTDFASFECAYLRPSIDAVLIVDLPFGRCVHQSFGCHDVQYLPTSLGQGLDLGCHAGLAILFWRNLNHTPQKAEIIVSIETNFDEKTLNKLRRQVTLWLFDMLPVMTF
jgi:hypothetical protein